MLFFLTPTQQNKERVLKIICQMAKYFLVPLKKMIVLSKLIFLSLKITFSMSFQNYQQFTVS